MLTGVLAHVCEEFKKRSRLGHKEKEMMAWYERIISALLIHGKVVPFVRESHRLAYIFHKGSSPSIVFEFGYDVIKVYRKNDEKVVALIDIKALREAPSINHVLSPILLLLE